MLGRPGELGRGPRSPRHQASATMHQLPSGWRRTMLEPSPLSRTRSVAGVMPAISRSPSTSARSPEASTAWTVADSGSRNAIRSAMVSRRLLPLRPGPTTQGRRTAPRSYWASTASRSPSLNAADTSWMVSSGRRATGGKIGSSIAGAPRPGSGPLLAAPRLSAASGGLAFLGGKRGGQARAQRSAPAEQPLVQGRGLRRRRHADSFGEQLGEFVVVADGAGGFAQAGPCFHQAAVGGCVQRLVRDGAPEGRGGGLVAAGCCVQPAGREQGGLEAAAQLVPAGLRPFARGQPGQEVTAVGRERPLQRGQGRVPAAGPLGRRERRLEGDHVAVVLA